MGVVTGTNERGDVRNVVVNVLNFLLLFLGPSASRSGTVTKSPQSGIEKSRTVGMSPRPRIAVAR